MSMETKEWLSFSLTMLLLVTPLPLSSSSCMYVCECVLCDVVVRSLWSAAAFPTALCCWTDPCSIKLKTASLSLSLSLTQEASLAHLSHTCLVVAELK